MIDHFDLLIEETAQILGFSPSPEHMAQFETYADLLVEWNQKVNLTAITQPDEVRLKHFLDSLSCFTVMQGTPMDRVVDVGSGAGFPGLPLKILYPDMHLTLVESVAKKTGFLAHVVAELGLEDVTILTDRAETAGQHPDHRESYDWALARAVAGMPVLMEYLLPLVKVGGITLAQKGPTAPRELEDAQVAIQTLGGQVRPLYSVTLPGIEEERFLVVVEKTQPTPAKYPRRPGMPAKRPLG